MKKKVTKKSSNGLIKAIVFVLIGALTVYFVGQNQLKNNNAYAVGDLTINWGVPTGDPIFVVTNMLPGDTEQRDVVVTNNGPVARQVAIRSEKTSETLNFSTVLDFVIEDNGTPIYGNGSPTGPKTLDEFFADSADLNGMSLSTLGPGDSTTYTFIATFDINAGNEFQNAEVIFDLIIGIFVDDGDIPAECALIEFSGDPIFGTALGDSLNGGPGNDLIFGLEGGDSINGNGGDDCLVGGEGGDSLRGNDGNDVLIGNEGGDALKGNNGEDLLIGGEGDDQLDGGNENDQLFGNEGKDALFGGNGDDLLDGADGDDSLKGGNGNDTLLAGAGSDDVDGDAGDDIMSGGPGADSMDGGPGNDTINGDEGDDTMFGAPGDDTIIGNGGVDRAEGDVGTDTCDAELEITCEL